MEHRIVARTEDGPFRYQAWPTVAKAKDGTLFVGASGNRQGHFCPFGKNYLYESHDEGESWIGPRIINDSYLDDRDVGLLAWGEENLLMCTASHSPDHGRRLAARIPGARRHTVPGAGGSLLWNHPVPVLTSLLTRTGAWMH